MASMPVDEIRIQTSTGEIAAKWWGPKSVQPIVVIHGWQDNAGSFDTLIPLLPPNYSYLALDLPGHGRSYHVPPGYQYHVSDMVLLIEEIRQRFKWPKISLIGHSMGAIICFYYSSIFTDKVNLVCALDTLKEQSLEPEFASKLLVYRMLNSMNVTQRSLDPNQTPPEYTSDELVDRVYEGSFRSVEPDKAKYLLERGSKPSTRFPGKFTVSRDIRVKYMHPHRGDQATGLELIKRIKAPYLFVRGGDRSFREPQRHIVEAIEIFREHNPNFDMFRVEGTHHLHLNQPELIAEKIGEFLVKHHEVNAIDFDYNILKSKL